MGDRMMNAAYAMHMRQRMPPPGGSKPQLPPHIQSKLDARYGTASSSKDGADGGPLAGGGEALGGVTGESMAARMARRRQERSAARTQAMHAQLEDARGGPTWNGIGLRDVTINHQQAWQQNMQHNQQKMMEQQMQREQDAMQQRLLAREKQQVEVQRKRAAAKGGGAANVQSNLKVGYAAMQVDGTRG